MRHLASADFDGSTLRVLANDDDSGGKRNAGIRFECKRDGACLVVATSLGRPEGDFELRIRPAR